MLTFQFHLDGAHLNSSKWAYRNGYIEGVFQIFYGEQLFYEDIYLNVVELAEQLGKWRQQMLNGNMTNFTFYTLDADEPQFHFHLEEGGVLLSSQWQNFMMELLPIEEVIHATDHYLRTLKIVTNYPLRFINLQSKNQALQVFYVHVKSLSGII